MDKDRTKKIIYGYLAPKPNWGGSYHEKDTVLFPQGVGGCVDATFYKHGWKVIIKIE